MSPLRIAFATSWLRDPHAGSGTAVAIRHLARGLETLGHDVDVHVPPAGRTSSIVRRARFNLGLRRRLERSGPYDLVVGFDVDGVLAAGRLGVPYVLCLKGVAADEARFERGWSRLHLSLLGRVEAANARRADLVVVPSRYSARVAGGRYGLAPGALRVVPEPIRLEPWSRLRSDPPLRPEHPTILSVARQYPRKDTAGLLRAVSLLRAHIPDVRVRVIGGGPELGRLRALRRTLGLGETVRLEGPVPDEEVVRRAYFEADLFCLPSLQEGFGIVFLEAMAAGLPVVAARAGAAPEVVVEGETGVLVRPGDPEELAETLRRLLESPRERERLGRGGLARAGRFDVGSVSRSFLDAVGFDATGRSVGGGPRLPRADEGERALPR